MKIEFAPGAAGFHEAAELRAMVRVYADTQHWGHMGELMEAIDCQAAEHMDRPELEELREAERETPEGAAGSGRLRAVWDTLMGPGAREQELARQRLEALERAQRAEAASFDALAEAAQARQERDEALERIRQLEEALAGRG